jgi:hypothetical protein
MRRGANEAIAARPAYVDRRAVPRRQALRNALLSPPQSSLSIVLSWPPPETRYRDEDSTRAGQDDRHCLVQLRDSLGQDDFSSSRHPTLCLAYALSWHVPFHKCAPALGARGGGLCGTCSRGMVSNFPLREPPGLSGISPRAEPAGSGPRARQPAWPKLRWPILRGWSLCLWALPVSLGDGNRRVFYI